LSQQSAESWFFAHSNGFSADCLILNESIALFVTRAEK